MKKLKPKEPRLRSLILTASSGIVLGALLGVSLLLSRPVQVVSQTPEQATLSQPGNYNTYMIPGRVAGSESANLRSSKGRISRRTPGPVSFSEEEINYFFEQLSFAPPAEGEQEQPAGGPKLGPFKVRLVGDQVFASFKIVLDPQGSPFEMTVTSEIAFENTDSGPKLVLKDTRVNALPVPNLGGMWSSFVASRIAQVPWPEEVVEMWQNIRGIEVESDKVIAEVGLRRA